METITNVFTYIFEKDLIEEIEKVGQLRSFEKGETIVSYTQELTHIPLILSGALKVFKQNDDGDELLLYYLESGDTCSMSLTCCMRSKKSEIRAETESSGEMVMIPIEFMSEWILKYDTWRAFIFESYQSRFDELLDSIDQLAFHDLNDRVMKYLRDKVIATKSNELHCTHQEIADEINSSRVVISRILKKLEQQGLIESSRNTVTLLNI